MRRPPIRILDVSGSPEQMGHQHGAAYAAEIRAYTDERIGLVVDGAWSGGALDRGDVLDLAQAMLPAHESFSPALYTEMCAMAAAAGITPAEAVIVGGFTDFVDVVRAEVGGARPDTVQEDDCTAVIVPDGRADGAGFLAQTWDMHASATDYVIILRTHPTDGPTTINFTTTGALGQLGMNDVGVCVGINDLISNDGQIGVTWPFVVRRALQQTTADEAVDIVLAAPLAGGHNYHLFDWAGHGYSIEAMPSARPVTTLGDIPIVRTNHTLAPETTRLQGPKPRGLMEGSHRRRDTAQRLLDHSPLTAADMMALTREPGDICRAPQPPFHFETSGAAVMRPATGVLWAAWGQPSHNEFEKIPFEPAIRYVRLHPQHVPALAKLELEVFPTIDPADLYDEASLAELADGFPEGNVVVLDGDRPVGMGLGILVDFDFEHPHHDLTDMMTIAAHHPDHEWYYGTDIAVHPDYRGRGIGARLYELRKQVVRRLGKRGIVAGGVIPGYADHRDTMSADEYIAKVQDRELYDPTLSFQLDNGFEARGALPGYLNDASVGDNAVLIVWPNPDYT